MIYGLVRYGEVRQVRLGTVWQVRYGRVRQGVAWHGLVRYGEVRQVSLGYVRYGCVWLGRVWQVWFYKEK